MVSSDNPTWLRMPKPLNCQQIVPVTSIHCSFAGFACGLAGMSSLLVCALSGGGIAMHSYFHAVLTSSGAYPVSHLKSCRLTMDTLGYQTIGKLQRQNILLCCHTYMFGASPHLDSYYTSTGRFVCSAVSSLVYLQTA